MADNTQALELLDKNSLELLDLYLKFGDKRCPILNVSTLFTIGTTPIVEVELSNAKAVADNKTANNIQDLVKHAAVGGLVNIIASIGIYGQAEPLDIVLFSGYTRTSTPGLQATFSTIKSRTTLKLICGLDRLSSVPLGSLNFFGLGGNARNSIMGTPYSALLNSLQHTVNTNLAEANANFIKDPAAFVTKLIDDLRNVTKQQSEQNALVQESTISCTKELRLAMYANDSKAAESLKSQAVSGIQANATTKVLKNLLSELFLTEIPQTVCKEDAPCKMLLYPLNAWEKLGKNDKYPAITLDEILSIQQTTNAKFENTIDYWIVSYPQIGTTNINNVAVYGPGTEGEHGEARCYNPKEFGDRLIQSQGESAAFLSAKVMSLPGWTVSAPIKLAATPDKADGASKTTLKDPEEFNTSAEDVAKRLAVTSYLNEGRASCSVGLTVPFRVYLKALKSLGRVWSLQLPNLSSDVYDLDKIGTAPYYGLLSNMGLRISAEGGKLQTNCALYFSHLHTDKEHNTYAADNKVHATNEEKYKEAIQPAVVVYEALTK